LSFWGVQAAWCGWLPTFLFQQSRTSAQPWKPALDWDHFSTTCWRCLAGGKTAAVPDGWTWLGIGIWVGSALALLVCCGRAGLLVGLCAGLPVAAGGAYSLAAHNIVNVRYLIFAQIYLLVGWALLVAKARGPWRVALGAALLAWSGFGCWRLGEARDAQARFPGVRGAVAALERSRAPDEPVVVGSPFVHAIVQCHAERPAGISVPAADEKRYDLLGGPPLRKSDFLNLEQLSAAGVSRVWTIDVPELFGSPAVVQLPEEYRLVKEQRFTERFGFRMDLLVREYRWDASAQPAQRL
jgi:hypothetical protein